MNLLLLYDEDFLPDGTALLSGRRALHAREVLRACPSDTLRVGRWKGPLGQGRVLHSSSAELRLEVSLTAPPPPKVGMSLLLALPRPKALKKVLAAAASLGLERVVLCNAALVERSYFTSKVLREELLTHLQAGLEQAGDTVPPEVLIRERFRPFVEDDVGATFGEAQRWVAHPGAERARQALTPVGPKERVVLAIGPEGGWVPFELGLLQAAGFTPFSFGERTLRVEVAVPYALGLLVSMRDGRPVQRAAP
jgi:RsmE family RNA methyltransferase